MLTYNFDDIDTKGEPSAKKFETLSIGGFE